MRRPLSGVQARVDRLASRLSAHAGCPECRGKEDTARLLVVYGDEPAPPEASAEHRCDQCQRVIPYHYVVVSYDPAMRPPDL